MRLFHASEEESIARFEPRKPTRQDLDPNVNLVWAIEEAKLVNFLTPRDCPRVTYYAKPDSTEKDIERFIGNNGTNSVIAIEYGWFQLMRKTKLTIYEFDPGEFILKDEIAGYYVSTKPQIPIGKMIVDDLFSAIFERQTELRVLPNLWDLCDAIVVSSLGYSMCRMRNAIPRQTL